MYAQGIPDPRSRSFHFLIGSSQPSQESQSSHQPVATVSRLETLQHVKLSSGAQAFSINK
jgi:hypothetical protein